LLAIDNKNTNNTTKISRLTTPVEFAFILVRSPLTKKLCPGRLKLFFDHLGLRGEREEGDSIEEQGKAFLAKAKSEEPYWAGDSILFFLDHHKQRVLNKEGLAAGTLNNYYQTIKTFL
jgi:hypothetical protein